MTAAPSVDELIARVPELTEHTVAPPALAPLAQARRLEKELRAALAQAPGHAAGHAALGNLLARRGLYLAARDAYLQAVAIDDAFACAHLAICELSSILRDEATAAPHLRRALDRRRRFDDSMPVGDRTQLLLLLRDAPYSVNAPVELILDRTRFAVHKLYVGVAPSEAPPPFDVAFCAFGPESGEDPAAANLRRVLDGRQVLNDPVYIARCARERLSSVLSSCAGIRAIDTEVVATESLPGLTLPFLMRPLGTHAGIGFTLVTNPEELRAHAARFPSSHYHISGFTEYRSADGFYRKYRIIIVDGVPYPYHLAISPRWMVHYQTSPMEEHEWMRAEELAFLENPASVFAGWGDDANAIASALALDYVGLDVTLLADGTTLVFEADPAMLVHDEETGSVFEYKQPYVARIRDALAGLLRSR